MLTIQELTYMATITVEIPHNGEILHATVKLLPEDKIETIADAAAAGQVVLKPLRECTLADLALYADQIESEIKEDLSKIRLIDLAQSESERVKITILNDKEGLLPQAARLLASTQVLFDIVSKKGKEGWEKGKAQLEALRENLDRDPKDEDGAEAEGPVEEVDRVVLDEIKPLLPEYGAGESQPDGQKRHEPPSSESLSAETAAEPASPEDQSGVADHNSAANDDLTLSEAALPEQVATTQAEPAASLDPVDLFSSIVVLDSQQIYADREVDVAEGAPPQLADYGDQRVAGIVLPVEQPSPAAADILLGETSFDDMKGHAGSSLSREVAGFLIGPPPEKQPNGRYIVQVTQAIRAEHTRMHGASVTYTPESWRHISDWLMTYYPNEEQVIVGWYHTHPGFGIFLSNMDLFIHHNFFSQKWHIAYVLDPIGKRSGFFTWDTDQKEVLAYPFPWPYWAHSSW